MALPGFSLVRPILPLIASLFALSTGPSCAQEMPADRDEIVHVLNRITFGPRPGDVEAVEKMGLNNYIQQQLHPETIDDSAVDRDLAGFELLQMSPQQLTQLFDAERKNALKKQKKLAEAASANGQQAQPAPAAPNPAPMQDVNQNSAATQVEPPAMQTSPQEKVAKLLEQTNAYRSVAAIGQLEQAKLVRAVDSQRQLQEVLVDFWSNHFNIDMKKGPDRILKVVDDRDVIRPHIWGSFRDLLEASAKSPAMLFYLDNAGNTVARTVTLEAKSCSPSAFTTR